MRHLWTLAATLCLAAFSATAPAGPAKADKPACGSHGTTIEFVDTPRDAATQAKKEEKLVFVLHVSGHFEDPRFT
jgi:hypothetical protein